MERREAEVVVSLLHNKEKGRAQRKLGYWQTAGNAILNNDELGEKWCAFVEEQVNDDMATGVLLDETLQIMTMIRSNMPLEIIAQTVKQIPGGQTIIDEYLSGFVRPEILEGIKSHMESKKI